MKVFISWSGKVSHRVAQEFRDWLPKVIQRAKPFISSQDIDKGNRWGTEMVKELQESAYGILCVTKDNLQAPWLNFEAGALSTKFPDRSQVAPFLFNLKGSDIKEGHPILQFQYVRFDREDVKKMIKSLNEACGSDCLKESDLDEVFDTWWPKLEPKLTKIMKEADLIETIPTDEPQGRSTPDILEELVELVRSQNNTINDLKLVVSSPDKRFEADWAAWERRNTISKLNSATSSLTKLLNVLDSYGDEPPFDFIKQTTRDVTIVPRSGTRCKKKRDFCPDIWYAPPNT